MSATLWSDIAFITKVLISNRLPARKGLRGRMVERSGERYYRYPMGGHLPSKIRAGANLTVEVDGFTLTWGGSTGDRMRWIDRGRAGMPARPFVGLDDKELAKQAIVIVDDLVEDGRKMGIFK